VRVLDALDETRRVYRSARHDLQAAGHVGEVQATLRRAADVPRGRLQRKSASRPKIRRAAPRALEFVAKRSARCRGAVGLARAPNARIATCRFAEHAWCHTVDRGGVLDDAEDAFDALLQDFWRRQDGQAVLERDDGTAGPALAASYFFLEPPAWPPEENRVFGMATGRVLDVGGGAGRHCLAARDAGLPVVGDISPGVIDVCKTRGVADAQLLPSPQPLTQVWGRSTRS
jgi:hypothetical protein